MRPEKLYLLAEIQIRQGDEKVSVLPLASRTDLVTQPATLEIINGTAILSWGMSGIPVRVRYTTDNGQSWTTVGLDVTDGNLAISLAELPAADVTFDVTIANNNEKSVQTIEFPLTSR